MPAERYAVKFIVNWVNEVILTAMRDIISHGAIEVSASKDQAFYIDKLQSRGVQLEVCSHEHSFPDCPGSFCCSPGAWHC